MSDQLSVLNLSGNFAVIKIAERAYPAVAIQVDTFHGIAQDVERMRNLLQKGDVTKLAEELDYLNDELGEILQFIQTVCDLRSVKLPYAKGRKAE